MGAPDLGKMIGPLPLGAWLAVTATGVGLVVYTRRNAPASTVDTGIPEDVGTVPGVGVGGSWVAVPPPTDATGSGAPAPTTNEEWAVQAINGLIGMGYPPATVDSAIRKYIAGESNTLSVSEWAIVRIALSRFLSPPQPLPPGGSDPGTVPAPTPSPTAPKYVMRLSVRNSMYGLMRASHPSLSAAMANQRAAVAIDYNRLHGINPWGTTPRAQATQKAFTGRVWVY